MLLSVIRWLKGTVTFIIMGKFPERFISACRKSGIHLWNIKRQKDNMSANAFASDYKKIRHIARRNTVKVRLKNKKGAYLLRKKYRKRIGIPIGIFASATIVLLFSTRIWKIEIKGCESRLADSIISELKENGLKIGCIKNGINVKDLQSKIMLEEDEVSWISINIVGSTAYIEVSERRQPPEKFFDSNNVANIVAECDAQIKYLEIYSGQAMVKVGETVSKGDILVSGIMEDQYGKKQFKYARAKVIARTEQEDTVEMPLKQFVWQKAGEPKVRCYIEIADRSVAVWGLPLKEETYSMNQSSKKFLGINIVKKIYIPQKKVEIMLTEKQAKEQAMKILDSYDEVIAGEKIVSCTRKAELLNGVLKVTENKVVEKDIAVTREFEWQKSR